MNKTKSNVIELVIGDWSGDGHNITNSIVIKTNLTQQEMIEAYQLGVQKIGFDLIEDVCADYEDNKISEDVYEKLVASGYKFDDDCVVPSMIEPLELGGSDDYADIYLHFVKIGNPQFVFSYGSSIKIGGYGLFFC